MTNMNRPLIRYHEGKFRMAPWVISHFPKHTCNTESFGGTDIRTECLRVSPKAQCQDLFGVGL